MRKEKIKKLSKEEKDTIKTLLKKVKDSNTRDLLIYVLDKLGELEITINKLS